VLLSRPALVQH